MEKGEIENKYLVYQIILDVIEKNKIGQGNKMFQEGQERFYREGDI